jgi:hypothetical protein
MIDLTVEALGYLEVKRSLESVKESVADLGTQLQINLLVLGMLEKEILKYPVPKPDLEPSDGI